MTLSMFLRDHIYIPLGGNRVKVFRQAFNLLLTMGIGGLWHGAGWNFIVWGLAHGICLAALHVSKIKLPQYINIVFTFFVVTLLWVLFRAIDLGSAMNYYKVLFNFHGHWFGDFRVNKEFLIVISFLFVWGFPNTLRVLGYNDSKIHVKWWHSFFGGVLAFMALKTMATTPAISFVYFNF